MSLIQVKVKHGRTFDEARDRLALAVGESRPGSASMVRTAEWSPGRDSVILDRARASGSTSGSTPRTSTSRATSRPRQPARARRTLKQIVEIDLQETRRSRSRGGTRWPSPTR